jgi:hypothetical protein
MVNLTQAEARAIDFMALQAAEVAGRRKMSHQFCDAVLADQADNVLVFGPLPEGQGEIIWLGCYLRPEGP